MRGVVRVTAARVRGTKNTTGGSEKIAAPYSQTRRRETGGEVGVVEERGIEHRIQL